VDNMIGICGDSCMDCPRYIAAESGKAKDLEDVKAWWVRLGLRAEDFPAADMACKGCRPENACAYPEIRDCAKSRGHRNCGLCDRYPCGLVAAAFEKTAAFQTRAAAACTQEELDILERAFFRKRHILDWIQLEIYDPKK
jgi:hypothetical protein